MTVELVFDPFDLTQIQVRYQGRPMGQGVPAKIGQHVHPKARPEVAATPTPATGIDYLALVQTRHDQQTRLRDGLRQPVWRWSCSARSSTTNTVGITA